MVKLINEFTLQLIIHINGLKDYIMKKHSNVDGLESTIMDYLSNLKMTMEIEGSSEKLNSIKEKSMKAKRVRVCDKQCEARIWGKEHDGNERCFFSGNRNGLCTKHSKAEAECGVPCTVNSDGSKLIGLYMGRIDDFQEGEAKIPPYKDSNNIVRIHWKSKFMQEHISNEIEQGRCKLSENRNTKKDGN